MDKKWSFHAIGRLSRRTVTFAQFVNEIVSAEIAQENRPILKYASTKEVFVFRFLASRVHTLDEERSRGFLKLLGMSPDQRYTCDDSGECVCFESVNKDRLPLCEPSSLDDEEDGNPACPPQRNQHVLRDRGFENLWQPKSEPVKRLLVNYIFSFVYFSLVRLDGTSRRLHHIERILGDDELYKSAARTFVGVYKSTPHFVTRWRVKTDEEVNVDKLWDAVINFYEHVAVKELTEKQNQEESYEKPDKVAIWEYILRKKHEAEHETYFKRCNDDQSWFSYTDRLVRQLLPSEEKKKPNSMAIMRVYQKDHVQFVGNGIRNAMKQLRLVRSSTGKHGDSLLFNVVADNSDTVMRGQLEPWGEELLRRNLTHRRKQRYESYEDLEGITTLLIPWAKRADGRHISPEHRIS